MSTRNAQAWAPVDRERYNAAIGQANSYRRDTETMLADGVPSDDPKFLEVELKWTRALDDADKIAERAEALASNTARTVAGDAIRTAPDVTPIAPQVPVINAEHDAKVTSAFQRDYERRTANPEYKASFDAYLRRLALPDGFAQREKDILQEGVDTLGGFLVPADVVPGIMQRLRMRSVMWGLTAERATARDRIKIIRVTPASGTDSSGSPSEQIYSSGFVGDWTTETGASTETEPAWSIIEIPVKKAKSKTRITFDELADSEVDLVAFLTDDGGGNLGLVADKGFIIGTGAAGQPMGILSSPDRKTAIDIEGTTANTISNTTANRGSADKLLDLVYALPSQYAQNAQFLTHRLTELPIRKLVDAENRYIWAAGFADKPNELLGYPINRSDFMPQQGTDANQVIAFGDFNEAYIKAVRMAVTAQIDPYTKADNDIAILYLRMRVGGDVRNSDAYRTGVV